LNFTFIKTAYSSFNRKYLVSILNFFQQYTQNEFFLETLSWDQSAEILSIIKFLTLMKEKVASRLVEEMFFVCFGKDKQMIH